MHSDVDLLAVVEGIDPRFDPEVYSVYSKERLTSLWQEGNPFAWHLALESVLLYTSDGCDPLDELGQPSVYRKMLDDCCKFYSIYEAASDQLFNGNTSEVFELSIIFLAIRNIATCYSLGATKNHQFSRDAALRLGESSLSIDSGVYSTLSDARTLSTRGKGRPLRCGEIEAAKSALPEIKTWMLTLLEKAERYDGISD